MNFKKIALTIFSGIIFIVLILAFGRNPDLPKINEQPFPEVTEGINYPSFFPGDTVIAIPMIVFDEKQSYKPNGKRAFTITEKWPLITIALQSVNPMGNYKNPEIEARYLLDDKNEIDKYYQFKNHLEAYGYLANAYSTGDGITKVFIY